MLVHIHVQSRKSVRITYMKHNRYMVYLKHNTLLPNFLKTMPTIHPTLRMCFLWLYMYVYSACTWYMCVLWLIHGCPELILFDLVYVCVCMCVCVCVSPPPQTTALKVYTSVPCTRVWRPSWRPSQMPFPQPPDEAVWSSGMITPPQTFNRPSSPDLYKWLCRTGYWWSSLCVSISVLWCGGEYSMLCVFNDICIESVMPAYQLECIQQVAPALWHMHLFKGSLIPRPAWCNCITY